MTMPNRMHGKSIPPRQEDLKVCPYCKSRYVQAKKEIRGNTIIQRCPMCNQVLPMKDIKK